MVKTEKKEFNTNLPLVWRLLGTGVMLRRAGWDWMLHTSFAVKGKRKCLQSVEQFEKWCSLLLLLWDDCQCLPFLYSFIDDILDPLSFRWHTHYLIFLRGDPGAMRRVCFIPAFDTGVVFQSIFCFIFSVWNISSLMFHPVTYGLMQKY